MTKKPAEEPDVLDALLGMSKPHSATDEWVAAVRETRLPTRAERESRTPNSAERGLGCTCDRVAHRGAISVVHQGGCPFPARPPFSADELIGIWDDLPLEALEGFLDWLHAEGYLDVYLDDDDDDDETPPVTGQVQAAWGPLIRLEQYVTAKLGSQEYRLAGLARNALTELAALWREYTRGERPCPVCGSEARHDLVNGHPSAPIRKWQADHPVSADEVLEAYRTLSSGDRAEFHRRARLDYRADVKPRPQPVAPPVTSDRLCACGCGQPVTSPRPEAKYATGACRVRALRARA